MKKQSRFQKQIRILGLLLSLVFAATLFVVVGTPAAACPMEACEIEAKETTITAGEEITFVVWVLDGGGNNEGWANYVFGSDPFHLKDGCKFEIDPAAGGSWDVNTYTSEIAGEWEVTVSCTVTIEGATNTAEDTVTITVLEGNPGTFGPSKDELVKKVNNYENAVLQLMGTNENTNVKESTAWVNGTIRQIFVGFPLYL